jgi:hypothetical protein
MPGDVPAKAEEVAALYGVAKSTVYRWYEADAFDSGAVTAIPNPQRDRLLFDRKRVGKQFEREMLDPKDTIPDETRQRRSAALEVFLDA